MICPRKFRAMMCAAVVMVAGTARLAAETRPERGAVDSRIRTTAYSPDEVYRLYGFVGYAIELIFEDGESYQGSGGGDLNGVTIDHFASSVLVKPRAAQVTTNLVIYTDRRAYRFDYSAEDRKPNRYSDDLMYAVRFAYPPRALAVPTAEDLLAREIARMSSEQPRNLSYGFCGHRSLKPMAASDDGIHTRIRFAPQAELPAIFVRNEDGSESLLNFSLDQGDVVVHRLASKFILRRGRLTGCVVNQAYAGSGTRLETGTVSPRIEREVREVRP
jgi:type IV secretion system protein VirB9